MLAESVDEDGNHYLSAAGESAASEIRAVFLAIVRGCMTARMKAMAEPAGGDDIPQWIADAHAERYLPWAKRLAPGVLAAVIDLVVDKIVPGDDLVAQEVLTAIEAYGAAMSHKKTVDKSAALY
jgi:hypothetical protein